MHLTSLPGPDAVGHIGKEAEQFLDFLADSGQSWWQTLPINPVGAGFSPYSTISSFAGEPLLIDREIWRKLGFISGKKSKTGTSSKANFALARKEFNKVSREAFAKSRLAKSATFSKSLEAFVRKEAYWLQDYALFCAIANELGTNWPKWPHGLREREPEALRIAREKWSDEIAFHYFLQYSFSLSWFQLQTAAKERGIGLIGDIPIFVAHDSVDVWANQKYFWLNSDGSPKYVAGVPPDYFNKDGQLWGNALYNWPALQKDGFSFWVKRLRRLLDLFDLIRVDHFIGFYRYWEISAKATTAKRGRWVLVPGMELFRKLQKEIGPDRMIAEDLGLLVPGVIQLRDHYSIPGMRVFQFGFGNDGDRLYHMPHQCPQKSVAYTGTHDNDTITGWYEAAQKDSRKKNPSFDFGRMQTVLGTNKREVHWRAIQTTAMSAANVAIYQMQDALGLGSKARMNVPGTPSGNWTWRLKEVPSLSVASKLLEISQSSDRA